MSKTYDAKNSDLFRYNDTILKNIFKKCTRPTCIEVQKKKKYRIINDKEMARIIIRIYVRFSRVKPKCHVKL